MTLGCLFPTSHLYPDRPSDGAAVSTPARPSSHSVLRHPGAFDWLPVGPSQRQLGRRVNVCTVVRRLCHRPLTHIQSCDLIGAERRRDSAHSRRARGDADGGYPEPEMEGEKRPTQPLRDEIRSHESALETWSCPLWWNDDWTRVFYVGRSGSRH